MAFQTVQNCFCIPMHTLQFPKLSPNSTQLRPPFSPQPPRKKAHYQSKLDYCPNSYTFYIIVYQYTYINCCISCGIWPYSQLFYTSECAESRNRRWKPCRRTQTQVLSSTISSEGSSTIMGRPWVLRSSYMSLMSMILFSSFSIVQI